MTAEIASIFYESPSKHLGRAKMKLASWPGFKVPISLSALGSRAHFLSTR